MTPITVDDLRGLMERNGWTQVDLAHALNTSQSAVSLWLAGTRSPGRASAIRIREMLADPASVDVAGARSRIHDIVDALPESAVPLVAAMLAGVAGHYGIRSE